MGSLSLVRRSVSSTYYHAHVSVHSLSWSRLKISRSRCASQYQPWQCHYFDPRGRAPNVTGRPVSLEGYSAFLAGSELWPRIYAAKPTRWLGERVRRPWIMHVNNIASELGAYRRCHLILKHLERELLGLVSIYENEYFCVRHQKHTHYPPF